MSENDNDNNNKRKQRPMVGMPTPEADERHREKIITSGRRKSQGVINLRSTGDNNYMKVVREQHERRKLLEAESKRGLPKDAMIWDDKKPIDGRLAFADEKGAQNRTNRRPGDKPLTET